MSVESSFDWVPVQETSALGRIFRPIALLEIKAKSGEWKTFYPEVDSGSPITILNESDGDRLGLDLSTGRPMTISGVFGSSRLAYIHEVEVRIGSDATRARVAFTTGDNHKQLLGRVDIFQNFRICLRGRVLQTAFLRE